MPTATSHLTTVIHCPNGRQALLNMRAMHVCLLSDDHTTVSL